MQVYYNSDTCEVMNKTYSSYRILIKYLFIYNSNYLFVLSWMMLTSFHAAFTLIHYHYYYFFTVISHNILETKICLVFISSKK